MVSQRATALTLHESQLAELEISGATRPVTKTPLTGAQVTTLLREIAPSDAASLLDRGMSATFSYASADGAFVIVATRDGALWRARVTLDEGRERQRLTGHFKAMPLPDDVAEPPQSGARPAAPRDRKSVV